ncbi:MAG TPA: SusC/RagA family TonB-linked outer membrane protein [Niabella sp.]|nr:SusC/RagA family TonB-linked outer membrane protein [Niabella sp.]
MKKTIKQLLFSVLASCLVLVGYAQQRTVTGTVMDENGSPMAGVSYVIKGTKIGGVTNEDGNFTVSIQNANQVIELSSVGFKTQSVTVGNQTSLNIVMLRSEDQMEGVVVTALGIKRDQRKVGYATTTIASKDIIKAAPTNFASALYGKAPGVTITSNPGGATSAVGIQIRGLSSITGQAQPLLVVDGVVVRNGDANNDGYWGGNQRINGNGLLDINPENIESINILKGAAASAIYGSDANFGVIVITTKNGKGVKKGLGIDVNLTGSLEKAYIPNGYQSQYGPGYDRATNKDAFGADDEGWIHATVDGKQVVYPIFRAYAMFGPKVDGREVYWWDGQMRPYTSQGTIWEKFYRTGNNTNANIALSNSSDKYNYRLSYTRNDYTGIQRGGNQQKNTFNLNSSFTVTPKISMDLVSTYINEFVHNRPRQVYYLTNNYGGFVSPVDRMDVYLNKYQTTKGYKYVPFNSNLDPDERIKYSIRGYDFLDFLWNQLANSYDESTNRLMNSLTLNYKIFKGLSLRGRYGNDFTSYFLENKERSTQPLSFGASGYYGTAHNRYLINYGDMLLRYEAEISPKVTLTPSIGYQARVEDYRYTSAGTRDGLTTENWFSLSASKTTPTSGSASRAKLIKDGLFGILNVDYGNFLFVEGTFRQERSSTLFPGNNVYYYGGVSGAFELSNAFQLPKAINYSKLRASWGTVGNPPGMYRANVIYNAGSIQGVPILTPPSSYGNQDLKNERKDNIELGWENRFFGSRLGVDLTWYRDKIIDQILPLSIPASTGASSVLVNVGTMQSTGVEIGIYGTPIKGDNFNWDTRLNLAFNNNKVTKLMPDLDELTLSNIDNGSLIVKAEVNKKAGDIYVYKRKLSSSGEYLINDDGFYVVDYSKMVYAGNIQSKVVGGFINTLSYKNLSLNLVTDFNFGGQVTSAGLLYQRGAGMYDNSLFGRDAEHGGIAYYNKGGKYIKADANATSGPNGEKIFHDGIILDGVTESGQKNTTIVDAGNYYLTTYQWGSWPGYASGSLYEGAIYNNDYIKLREASLSYVLPVRLNSKWNLQNLTLSIYGRNLFYLYKTLPYVDAEDGTGTNWVSRATSAGSANAATRSVGVSIRLSL